MDDNSLQLSAMLKAVIYIDSQPDVRLPIQLGMYQLILDQIEAIFTEGANQQPFLVTAYRAMATSAYYGLFRIGKIAWSQQNDHTIYV